MICGKLLSSYHTSGRRCDFLGAGDNKVIFIQWGRMFVCACLDGFAAADRLMDLFDIWCGLCVMYEINLKFSGLNEALACLHMGDYRLEGASIEGKWTEVSHSCGFHCSQTVFIADFLSPPFFGLIKTHFMHNKYAKNTNGCRGRIKTL